MGHRDVYLQALRCLDIAEQTLKEAGATIEDVIHTRIMLVDIDTWKDVARAHGERFGTIRPACTFVEVSRFIDPEWLIEIEVDAIVPDGRPALETSGP